MYSIDSRNGLSSLVYNLHVDAWTQYYLENNDLVIPNDGRLHNVQLWSNIRIGHKPLLWVMSLAVVDNYAYFDKWNIGNFCLELHSSTKGTWSLFIENARFYGKCSQCHIGLSLLCIVKIDEFQFADGVASQDKNKNLSMMILNIQKTNFGSNSPFDHNTPHSINFMQGNHKHLWRKNTFARTYPLRANVVTSLL